MPERYESSFLGETPWKTLVESCEQKQVSNKVYTANRNLFRGQENWVESVPM